MWVYNNKDNNNNETSFLFQRLSVLLQHLNSVLISESFCFNDEDPDVYSHHSICF